MRFMTTFTMTHDIDCDPDRFWELFFDHDMNTQMFKSIGFPEWKIIEDTDGEKERVRKIKATPKMELPSAVQKLVGPSFGYEETGRFDKAQKIFRFVITPTAMANKLRNEGWVKCEPNGAGKCKRIAEMIAEAKVFGIGGMIESSVEKGNRQGWADSAAFLNEWIKSHPK